MCVWLCVFFFFAHAYVCAAYLCFCALAWCEIVRLLGRVPHAPEGVPRISYIGGHHLTMDLTHLTLDLASDPTMDLLVHHQVVLLWLSTRDWLQSRSSVMTEGHQVILSC